METKSLTVNAPAAKTFGWLKVNRAQVQIPPVGRAIPLIAQIPEGVKAGNDGFEEIQATGGSAGHSGLAAGTSGLFREMRSGCGPEVEAVLLEAGITPQTYTVPEGMKAGTMRLTFLCPESDALGSSGALTGVHLEKNSELTLIMDYQTMNEAPARERHTALIVSRFVLEDGAVLRLAQVQRSGETSTLLHDVGARCEAGARLEQVRVILSGEASYDGTLTELVGDDSLYRTEIGYRVEGAGLLDMNYEADHMGHRTESAIQTSGVLKDQAHRVMRGTIDLRRGAAGAVGNEMDDVFLMSEGVRNVTVPVILCGEEDVVGNHGATIGRLSEDTVFYLESRGMNEEEIYRMMADAKLAAVIRKIPDEELQHELLQEYERFAEEAPEEAGAIEGALKEAAESKGNALRNEPAEAAEVTR